MVTITGKLNASVSGTVRATPDSPFVDTSTTPNTIVSQPIEAAITNGAFSITVPQSQNLSGQSGVTTEGITYLWELFRNDTVITFYFLDGTPYTGLTHLHTDGIYYTGSVHDATSKRLDRVSTTVPVLLQDPIHAVAPNSGTSVDFASLVAITAQEPYLDISLYRLAELLTTVALYRDRISTKLNIRGAYNAATFYALGDLVGYNGNGYVYRNASSLAGQTPPLTGDNTSWVMIASKGAAGGTGAQIVGYSAAAWANSAEAAAREDVRAAIASVSNIDLSAYALKAEAAPRNNPTFTGSVKRGSLTYPVPTVDLATEVPTAEYIEAAINARGITGFASPLYWARRILQQDITRDTSTIIFWDNRVINANTGVGTDGRFTVPSTGNYLIFMTLLLELSGATSALGSRSQVSVLLGIDAGGGTINDQGNVIFENDPSVSGAARSRRQGLMFTSLDASTLYVFRALFQGAGLNSSGHSISPGGGSTNNYFVLWKVG